MRMWLLAKFSILSETTEGRFCHNLPWLWKNQTFDKSYLITLCKNRHLEVSLPARIIQIDQVLTKLCMFRFDAYFLFKWNDKSTN